LGLAAGSRLGPYLIVSEVAAGGMGEVYRGRDAKLDRDVAIKVLPEAVAKDPDALARFEREAKAVAALSHPNILTIHDFGADRGITYAVMELLDGETLRHRLLSGRIPHKEAFDYALQILRGLAAAHERGIVHRDIKPENIFIARGGHLKVLDFGLAKRKETVSGPEDSSAPTASVATDPGAVMGTVGYMSPEQVVGEAVDARTDIFSFGAVLYEMLSGKRPFSRSTASQTVAAILRDEPPDLSESERDISPLLDHVVRHCLEKDRNRRFQSANDIAFALMEASGPSAASPASLRARRAGPSRTLLATGLLVLVSAVGLIALRRHQGRAATDKGVKRVVVLPFENLGSPEDDYFADGMSDAVRGKLTSLPGIEVIARGSSVGYKKTSKTPRQIADELGTSYLLMATVRWEKSAGKSRVQVSPELVQVKASGAPASRWQQPFDAPLTNVFDVQSDIATQVAESLGVALGNAEEKGLSEKPTQNVAAYDFYLKGEEAKRRFLFKEARAAYQRALTLDPEFAMAMLGLARISDDEQEARALTERARRLRNRLNPRERLNVDLASAGIKGDIDAMLQIARTLQARYPDDLFATMILANQKLSGGRPEDAINTFSQLLAIDPRNPEAYNQIGYYWGYAGEYEKSIEALKKYQALEPDQVNPYDSIGEVQAYSGRYDEAIATLNEGLRIRPDFPDSYGHLGVAYEGKGDPANAIQSYEKAADVALGDAQRWNYLSAALLAELRSGDRNALRRTAARVAQLRQGDLAALWKLSAEVSSEILEGRYSKAEELLVAMKRMLVELWEKAPKLSSEKPHFAVWNAVMALVKTRQGKNEEAMALYEENAYPPNPWRSFTERRFVFEARANLAALLARRGNLYGAEKLLAENRKWNPSWAPTRPQELEVERLRKEKPHTAAR
jgi:eukaryotic-like serine/threonine-protein kinase